MDPTVAGLLKDAHGFKTKAELGEWLSKNVEVAARHLLGERRQCYRKLTHGVPGVGTFRDMEEGAA